MNPCRRSYQFLHLASPAWVAIGIDNILAHACTLAYSYQEQLRRRLSEIRMKIKKSLFVNIPLEMSSGTSEWMIKFNGLSVARGQRDPYSPTPGTRHFMSSHDDVIKWKHFPRYRTFVRESTVELPSQSPVTRSFDVFLDLRLKKTQLS